MLHFTIERKETRLPGLALGSFAEGPEESRNGKLLIVFRRGKSGKLVSDLTALSDE